MYFSPLYVAITTEIILVPILISWFCEFCEFAVDDLVYVEFGVAELHSEVYEGFAL